MVDLQIGAEGITPELMTKFSKIPPVDSKTYGFIVDEVTLGNNQKTGRPQITAWLRITDDQKYPNSRLPFNMNLPWISPETGQWDVSFGYTLVDLMNGTGKPWVGDIRKPEVQEAWKVTLVGATGFMRVGQQPDKEDSSIIYNRVKVIAAKR